MDPRRVRAWRRDVNRRRIDRFATVAADRVTITRYPLSPLSDGVVFQVDLDGMQTRVAISPTNARRDGVYHGRIPECVGDAVVALCYRAARQQNRRP